MHTQYLFCLKITFILCLSPSVYAKNGVTYDITGRLGDNIMTFCQHKWLTHCHDNLDLHVPDFTYKEYFGLSQSERDCSATSQYRRRITLAKESDLSTSIDGYLYNGSFYMQLNGVSNRDELGDFLFKKSIEDHNYGTHIRQALSLQNINLNFELPTDRITVAVHIRKGCDFDYPLFSKQYQDDAHALERNKTYSDHHHCLKFPPEQFYAEQIEKLYTYLDKAPLYVRIFSDAPEPEKILKRLQHYLGTENDIIFSTEQSDFLRPASLITDIYAMSMFDYLIRSESHFPWISQMIGNHKGIIRPVACAWEGAYLKMTRILIDLPDRKNNSVTTIDF